MRLKYEYKFFFFYTYAGFKSKIHNNQVRQLYCTWDLNQHEFAQKNWECKQQYSW